MSVRLRPVAPEDRGLLLAIYASSREREMAIVPWTPDQKSAFLTMQFGAQERHYREKFPQSQHSIIVAGDEDAGRIWIDRSGEVTQILDVTVLPAHRGRGIGSAIIRDVQAERRPVSIYVDAFTPAVEWFVRRGFVKASQEPMQVLMRWDATGD